MRHQQGIGKPIVRQGLEMWTLWRSQRFTPGEYLWYGFDRKDLTKDQRSHFVSNHWHWHEHLPRLNDPRFAQSFTNKWTFDRFLRGFGFPLPDCVGLLHPRSGMTVEGRALTTPSALAAALPDLERGWVLKPVDGWQGEGVVILESLTSAAGSVTFELASGESLGGGEAFARWFPGDSPPPLIVQERVSNHPEIAELSPDSTSTVRIVTLAGRGDDVLVPLAGARFGRSGSVVDNYSRGGVLASIDPETGTLGRGTMKDGGGWAEVSRHPDTGEQLEGRRLPWWQETVDLVRRLSAVTRPMRTVGWDIVITEAGPVVLEGNHDWGIMMMQSHGFGYLSVPGVRETLVAHGVSLP